MVDEPQRELARPPGAESGPDSVELVRVWASHGEQHAVLRADAWGDEPSAWGILLVDLARHIAGAHTELYGRPEAESLARIKQLFDAEWAHSTDAGKGHLL